VGRPPMQPSSSPPWLGTALGRHQPAILRAQSELGCWRSDNLFQTFLLSHAVMSFLFVFTMRTSPLIGRSVWQGSSTKVVVLGGNLSQSAARCRSPPKTAARAREKVRRLEQPREAFWPKPKDIPRHSYAVPTLNFKTLTSL